MLFSLLVSLIVIGLSRGCEAHPFNKEKDVKIPIRTVEIQDISKDGKERKLYRRSSKESPFFSLGDCVSLGEMRSSGDSQGPGEWIKCDESGKRSPLIIQVGPQKILAIKGQLEGIPWENSIFDTDNISSLEYPIPSVLTYSEKKIFPRSPGRIVLALEEDDNVGGMETNLSTDSKLIESKGHDEAFFNHPLTESIISDSDSMEAAGGGACSFRNKKEPINITIAIHNLIRNKSGRVCRLRVKNCSSVDETGNFNFNVLIEEDNSKYHTSSTTNPTTKCLTSSTTKLCTTPTTCSTTRPKTCSTSSTTCATTTTCPTSSTTSSCTTTSCTTSTTCSTTCLSTTTSCSSTTCSCFTSCPDHTKCQDFDEENEINYHNLPLSKKGEFQLKDLIDGLIFKYVNKSKEERGGHSEDQGSNVLEINVVDPMGEQGKGPTQIYSGMVGNSLIRSGKWKTMDFLMSKENDSSPVKNNSGPFESIVGIPSPIFLSPKSNSNQLDNKGKVTRQEVFDGNDVNPIFKQKDYRNTPGLERSFEIVGEGDSSEENSFGGSSAGLGGRRRVFSSEESPLRNHLEPLVNDAILLRVLKSLMRKMPGGGRPSREDMQGPKFKDFEFLGLDKTKLVGQSQQLPPPKLVIF